MTLDTILSQFNDDPSKIGLIYGAIITGLGIAFALAYIYTKWKGESYTRLPIRYYLALRNYGIII